MIIKSKFPNLSIQRIENKDLANLKDSNFQ
jgi:hypothetical protein